jgi:hypothetical protein
MSQNPFSGDYHHACLICGSHTPCCCFSYLERTDPGPCLSPQTEGLAGTMPEPFPKSWPFQSKGLSAAAEPPVKLQPNAAPRPTADALLPLPLEPTPYSKEPVPLPAPFPFILFVNPALSPSQWVVTQRQPDGTFKIIAEGTDMLTNDQPPQNSSESK